MKLKPLQAGDQIALVAPASPFSIEQFTTVCEIFKDKGFRILPGKHIFQKRGYLAGQEAERAEDLIQAIEDPEVAAIVSIRGGYGSGRLLPWLPFTNLHERHKIFLGYSDITFLHLAFCSQMQWITFHGPNLIDANSEPGKIDNVLSSLRGETDFSWPLQDEQILRQGAANGKVFGGNLTCLAHLIGTKYFPDPEGAILLFEDCGEATYRLDRILNHLKLAGILPRLGGMVLGDFKNCGDFAEIAKVALDHSKPYDFPIIANLPFGHDGRNEVIPLGTPFHLNTYEKSFRAIDNPFLR